MVGSVTDGGPYVGSTDGHPDVTVSWSYGPSGRISRVLTEGALSDVISDRGPVEQSSAPRARRSRRFPGIFSLPTALTFY